MRKDPNFYKNYNVLLRKIGGGQDLNLEDNNQDGKLFFKSMTSYKIDHTMKKAAQWSYKVFPKDANYA